MRSFIRSRRFVKSDRGAALVEAAFVVPLLFTIVLGIWTTGRAYNVYLTLDHAAREAARYGAVNNDDANWVTEVKAKAIAEAAPSLALNAADVCAQLVDGAAVATDCLNAADDARTEKRSQVTITRQVPMNFLFFSFDVTLQAQAVSRWESGSE